jgi:hypothetical protein
LITSGYQCECGKVKQIANRWILGRFAHHGYFYDGDLISETCYIGLRPWDEEEANKEHVLHFCSEFCAYKWLAEELERMGR